MKGKITVFKESGKYYTTETIETPTFDFWEMLTYIKHSISQNDIPGVVHGASEFHVLAVEIKDDGSEGVPHLFPLVDNPSEPVQRCEGENNERYKP